MPNRKTFDDREKYVTPRRRRTAIGAAGTRVGIDLRRLAPQSDNYGGRHLGPDLSWAPLNLYACSLLGAG